MQNMKESPKEQTLLTESSEGPEYPYGLKIYLNNDQIKKLNINISDLKVNQTCEIKAKCYVCSIETRVDEEHENSSFSLQITDLETSLSKEKSTAERLYDKSE